MCTLARVCKLSLTHNVEWTLDQFTDDPYLDEIHADLRKAVMDGHNTKIPGHTVSIRIQDIEQPGNFFVVMCTIGYDNDTRTKTQKKFVWCGVIMDKFLDYIEGKKIEPC